MEINLEYIEVIVKDIIADLLKTKDILDVNKSFLELGINSVLAVELVEAINQKLKIVLGIEVVFDYFNTKELAGHIFNEFILKSSDDLMNKVDNTGISGTKIGYKGDRKSIENQIKEIIIGLKNAEDSLDLDKSFLELGINSILAVELVDAINQKLEIELGVEAVFDYSGIKELGEHIFSQYGGTHQEKDCIDNSMPDCRLSAAENKSDENTQKVIVNSKVSDKEYRNDIAIIGISGKFANSDTIEEFWNHLQAGECCIEEIKRKGWDENKYYDSNAAMKNKSISKWGGLLKRIVTIQ